MSDFLVFLPEMIAEPVFLFHHGTLVLVSLVLPHCQGCVYTVVAFTVAEVGRSDGRSTRVLLSFLLSLDLIDRLIGC